MHPRTKLRCGTTLRVFGAAFDARAFVKRHKIKTEYLWNEGEPPVPELPPLEHGGFLLRVSDSIAPFDQMDDAAKYLRKHRAMLIKISGCQQVEEVWLEVNFPMLEAKQVTSFMVPRSLINLAAKLGIKFVITAIPRAMARLKK
jgi:hypothetical protein